MEPISSKKLNQNRFDTLDECVSKNKNLVYKASNRYRGLCRVIGLDYEDLVSEGMIGLIRAYERYDHTKGLPFEPYAFKHIWGKVFTYVNRNKSLIRPSQAINKVITDINNMGLSNKPIEVISKQLDCKEKRVVQALTMMKNDHILSLDKPNLENSDFNFYDIISGHHDNTSIEVKEFISTLSSLELRMLKALTSGYSHRDAAKKLNISKTQFNLVLKQIREQANMFFQWNIKEEEVHNMSASFTKAEYLAFKENGVSDVDICKEKGIGSSALYKRKKKWGVVGMMIKNETDDNEELNESFQDKESPHSSVNIYSVGESKYEKEINHLKEENAKLWDLIIFLRNKEA